jgi:hypothetical protein
VWCSYTDPYWSIDPSYTASSDIYALGVVLLQVLLGEDNIDENDQSIATRHADKVKIVETEQSGFKCGLEPSAKIGLLPMNVPLCVTIRLLQAGLRQWQLRSLLSGCSACLSGGPAARRLARSWSHWRGFLFD